MTSPEIGRLIGRDAATVSELRAGRRWPSGPTALRIYDLSEGKVREWGVETFKARRRLGGVATMALTDAA